MAESGADAARCAKCNTPLAGRTVVGVVVQTPEERRETVLCGDCAVVSCTNCGTDLQLDRLHRHEGDLWESHDLHECNRCGEAVPTKDIVELRHESNPNYRKLLCQDCLEEVPIPANIRVIRDVS